MKIENHVISNNAQIKNMNVETKYIIKRNEMMKLTNFPAFILGSVLICAGLGNTYDFCIRTKITNILMQVAIMHGILLITTSLVAFAEYLLKFGSLTADWAILIIIFAWDCIFLLSALALYECFYDDNSIYLLGKPCLLFIVCCILTICNRVLFPFVY